MLAQKEVSQGPLLYDAIVTGDMKTARAMKTALELIRPSLAARGAEPTGRIVIGTVKGDLHDIGKNLVAALLEGGGFEVTDLGVNVAPEKFLSAARERNAHIVAMSALLTTTMLAMKTTIDAFQQAGLRESVKILVGGAPVTQRFADEIGADGYSDNAVGAVALAKRAVAARRADFAVPLPAEPKAHASGRADQSEEEFSRS